MKNKGFKWLLTILSEVAANVRVLDTFVMRNFSATDYFFMENSKLQHRKVLNDLQGKEILQDITAEKSFNRNARSTQAIGHLRGGRIYFNESSLQEYFINPHHNFTYIQKSISQCSESCNIFTASVVLKEKYEMSLFFSHEGGKKKVKNIIWIQRIKDMLNSVNIIVQKSTGQQVKKAKYELVKDDQDFFWISFLQSCELVKIQQNSGKIHLELETPEISENSQPSSRDSLSAQVKRISVGKSAEPFNSDFLELICRKRIKERQSPDLKLPSRLFYAEYDEINAEKVKVLKMMSDRHLTSKSSKNEKIPRRTMWMDSSPRNFPSPLPRVSSPMLLSPDTFLVSQTKSPSGASFNLPVPSFPSRRSMKKLSLKGLLKKFN
jgi:hypothetical protein